jgi:hypothetical protein
MLTPGQIPFYWRLWAGVLAAKGWGSLSTKDKDSKRYEFHRENGLPQSMTKMNPRAHFDIFKQAAERVIKGSGPGATTAPEDGERKRLVWRIKEDAAKAGLDATYLAKVSTDLYGLACWDALALDDLTNFRDAIHNRAGTKLGHDTRSVPQRRMILDPEKKFVPKSTPQPTRKPQPIEHHAEAEPF